MHDITNSDITKIEYIISNLRVTLLLVFLLLMVQKNLSDKSINYS